ncbi:hypothetical protein phiG2_22 [Lysinibacillus phage phiG2]|nr:hypothetical protein phiG2_22 [Lysinibacillus phage phiG2]
MATFKKWYVKVITLQQGLNTINLDVDTNIVKLINSDMLGSTIYMSTDSDVTQNNFEEKSDVGASSSLVRPHPLGTAYLFNPSNNPVRVKIIEIYTEDISFIFNASNQVSISGVLTSDGLKATDLKQSGDRTLHVMDTTAHAKLDSIISLLTTANSHLSAIKTNTTKV